MQLLRSFQNPPDYVFVLGGTYDELRALEADFSKTCWSMIVSPPPSPGNGDQLCELKFTFSDPNEAMRFKLSV